MSTSMRTLDGLQLAATVIRPDSPPERAALLIHGAGVTRDEGGFFTRLAAGLAESGVASLRPDLPGHGESPGRQEDLTFTAVLNVIAVGVQRAREVTGAAAVSLIGTSFSGGIAAFYAAKRPADVDRLVLLNPLVDYRLRFIEEKPAWAGGSISDAGAQQLLEQGYVGHGPTFRLGRPILNEVFWFAPRAVVAEIKAPTLVVHGTKDTFVPVESSRQLDDHLTCEHVLLEVKGSQHGFAVHRGPGYADPQTQVWQAEVIRSVGAWLTAD
jgi:pimeloyl-ACP methyl ester carboxylesterase